MKKIIFCIATLIAAFGFSSCSSDEGFGGNPDQELNDAKQAIKSKLFGATLLDETPKQVVTTLPTYHWTSPIDIVKLLPESQTPQAVYSNYFYYSNGEPFTVVMLYGNGAYTHICGIYWYDANGEYHEQDLWDENTLVQGDKSKNPKAQWYNPNLNSDSKNTKGLISRQSDDAGAYEINLPKNTKFGFYQKSIYGGGIVCGTTETTCSKCKGTGKIYGVKCTTCKGTGKISAKDESHPFKFFSEKSLNWNNTCQTVTFNTDEDWTVVGFEDISRTGTNTSGFGCDHDFNDCVFAVNPKLNIQPLPVDPDDDPVPPTPVPDPDPEPQPIIYPNQGSVETNLSYTEKKDGDISVRVSIHIRDTTDVTITLPFVDQALKDDFAIVAKHDVEATYSDPITINGQTVELIYSINADGNLTITTKGITAEILQYCRETYSDGLTFESNLSYPKGTKVTGTPTITFTKEPYVYITSCVNNSTEATDYEIKWEDNGSLIYTNPKFGDPDGLNYTHCFYSTHSLEDLKKFDWFNVEGIDTK